MIDAISKTDVSWYTPILKSWKKTFYNKKWSKETDEYKFTALHTLTILITQASSNKEVITIQGTQYAYQPHQKILMLGTTPSILSTLHECGHAIWGTKEIDACRFSVALFKTVFPKEYSQLEWDGHMLKRKQT